MYESYFGLTERPFSIAPDPQYLYMSTRHKEAMAHLSYGLSQGGCFVVLTGEVGTGKTTLCRNLLGELPDNVDVALILNANINEQELLQTICDELKIDYAADASQKQLLDAINHHLLDTFSKNRHTVLIIDEAQLLSRDVLEQIRLLTNLETTKSKLLQIILIGQPELNELLGRNDLRQLAQRVTARYHLGALQRNEIEDYVNYRLSVAGCKKPIFSRQGLNKLHELTDGIPRKINVLADHALLATYANSQTSVDSKTIKAAAKDVFVKSSAQQGSGFALRLKENWLIFVAGLILLNGLFWWYFTSSERADVESNKSSEQALVEDLTINAPVDLPQNPEQGEVINGGNIVSDTSTVTLEAPNEISAPLVIESEPLSDDERALPTEAVINTQNVTNGTIEGDSSVPGTVVISEEYLDDSIDLEPEVEDGIQPSSLLERAEGDLPSRLETEFGRLLETSADRTGRIEAFRELASLWEVSMSERFLRPACEELTQFDLRCLGFSQWQQLERFNRPAVIVVNHGNQLHRVIVHSISADTAKVLVGDQVIDVSIQELQARWNNSGVLFWRPAKLGGAQAVGLLQRGDQSQSVVAARQYVNQALQEAQMPLLLSAQETQFDLDMSQKVFALQTRFGISGDSMIGNETYLLMNEIVKPESTPVLSVRVEY